MKKLLVLILSIATIIMCVCFAGCTDTEDNQDFVNNSFEIISTEKDNDIYYIIMYHKETKVMYLFIKIGEDKSGWRASTSVSGLTVMLDENGKPLLYEGD